MAMPPLTTHLPGSAVYRGDLYAPLPAALRGRVDLLVVITPYVPSGAVRLMPPEARDHEPRLAVDGGPDGLDVLRRVLAEAIEWLIPGGHLVTEIAADQLDPALAECARNRLAAHATTDDDTTVLIAGRRRRVRRRSRR